MHLTTTELAGQQAELLPAREALGNINVSPNVNVAVALNLGDEGSAQAWAGQVVNNSLK